MCQNRYMVALKRFLTRGHAEPFKGVVHGLAGGLCGMMFAYNTAAWLFRRERHLASNAFVYGFAILFELVQTRRHLVPDAAAAALPGRVVRGPHRVA